MANLILEFSRFEFKYVLHQRLRDEVEAELGYFMQLDPFVETTQDKKYAVRSLYYDDPAHSAFYDKIDGLRNRSKFRLRTYATTPDGNTPVFLEEKGRRDNRVFKHRTLLTPASQDFHLNNLMTLQADNQELMEKFQYEWFRKQIRPVALVDYLRRPYISRYDHEFRVTFDERLHGTTTDELFPNYMEGYMDTPRMLLPGYTVMEVKFDTTVPQWFHRIIQSYELRRVPLSKICEAMKTLAIAIDLE